MKIYHYNRDTGQFLGEGMADPDQMRPGEWILPAFSTPTAPAAFPADPATEKLVYRDAAWHLDPIPVPPVPDPPPPPTPQEVALAAIAALEQEQARRITARAQRELYLGIFVALGMTSAPAFTALKTIDDRIRAERAKL